MATSADFSKSVTEASDEVKDIHCEPCANDGKQIEAEGFCVDCSEYLCEQCYKNHTRYKAFKHHVLQDKNTMPVDITKAGVKDVCLEKCAVHSPKVIEYFCQSCDKLGCTACITINHRQCENVDHIPSIVKEPKTNKEFQEFKSALEEHLEAVNERKKTITSNQTETDGMKRKAKADLKKQEEEIKTLFSTLKLEMERRIEDIDKNNKKTLKTAEIHCDSINDELKQMKTDTDTKMKNQQKCELFIAMKNYKPRMEQVGIQCEKLVRESKIQRCITCVKDNQTAVAVRSCNQSTIVILSVSTCGLLSKDYHIDISYDCYSMIYSREKLFTVGFHKIEVIDMHGKLLETIETIYSKHIALSPDHKTIYMTNVVDNKVTSMTLKGEIKTTYQDKDLQFPQGITVDNEGFVYVCSHGTSTIHQLTEDCKKVQILLENVPGTTITYSNTENRLYLGCGSVIKVYQME